MDARHDICWFLSLKEQAKHSQETVDSVLAKIKGIEDLKLDQLQTLHAISLNQTHFQIKSTSILPRCCPVLSGSLMLDLQPGSGTRLFPIRRWISPRPA